MVHGVSLGVALLLAAYTLLLVVAGFVTVVRLNRDLRAWPLPGLSEPEVRRMIHRRAPVIVVTCVLLALAATVVYALA